MLLLYATELSNNLECRVLNNLILGGYKSLPHLIAKNTDYLIDSISMRMKHLDLYPNTPQVGFTQMRHGDCI